jgi:ABC-type transport system involved in cytochrome c biogenesis ATPase subunit
VTTVVKRIIITNLVQNLLHVHNVQAMYRPNVHLIGAQDAFKKAFTVNENVVCSTALDKFGLSMGQACMFLHS